ncbi:unnamed protein product, partial [Mesorhabditis spiculigera]
MQCIHRGCYNFPGHHMCRGANNTPSYCVPYERLTMVTNGDECTLEPEHSACPFTALNCGRHEPICVEMETINNRDGLLIDYDGENRICTLKDCPPDHHPCMMAEKGNKMICIPYFHIQRVADNNRCHMVNPSQLAELAYSPKDCDNVVDAVACWSPTGHHTCIAYDRPTKIEYNPKTKRTTCSFQKCPRVGEILCSSECYSIDDVKMVKTDGACELRHLRQGAIVVIVSCSLIALVVVVAIIAIVIRCYMTRHQPSPPPPPRRSPTTARLLPDSDSDEARQVPFKPTKNPAANNIKPQV